MNTKSKFYTLICLTVFLVFATSCRYTENHKIKQARAALDQIMFEFNAGVLEPDVEIVGYFSEDFPSVRSGSECFYARDFYILHLKEDDQQKIAHSLEIVESFFLENQWRKDQDSFANSSTFFRENNTRLTLKRWSPDSVYFSHHIELPLNLKESNLKLITVTHFIPQMEGC